MKPKEIVSLGLIILSLHSVDIIAHQNSILHEKGNDILEWLPEYNVPAVGIGLINDGKLFDHEVFGELRKGIPAVDNSIFTIASVGAVYLITE